MKKVLSGLGLFMLVVVALFLPGPASAAPGDNMWQASAGSDINANGTVTMKGGNTSVETTKAFAGFQAVGGEVLKLSYDLGEGVTCIGGAPRVFATVGGTTVNSWDQHIAEGVEAACKGELTLPPGEVTALGVVWDNGQEGTITVTGLRELGGKVFDFNSYEIQVLATVEAPTATEPTCKAEGVVTLPEQAGVLYKATTADGKVTVTAEARIGYEIKSGVDTTWTFPVAMLTGAACPSASPSATTTPPSNPPTGTPTASPTTSAPTGTPTASASPSDSLSPAAGVVGGSDGNGSGSLPLTGPRVLTGVAVGLLMVSLGGILIGIVKRRKEDDQEAMSAAI